MTFSEHYPNVVYILWGNHAKTKKRYINSDGAVFIEGTHPSPLSANKGGFFGNKYFSRTNEALVAMGKTPIDWSL